VGETQACILNCSVIAVDDARWLKWAIYLMIHSLDFMQSYVSKALASPTGSIGPQFP
jgi:hypothetical protein